MNNKIELFGLIAMLLGLFLMYYDIIDFFIGKCVYFIGVFIVLSSGMIINTTTKEVK